jgi:hypothetical protein
MADRSIVVLTPATEFDLLTVEECKLLLGLDPNDTSQDMQLQAMISVNSALLAEACNRTFAQEKVRESWREVGNGRLFLSHWPVKEEIDIESVTAGDVLLVPGEYELEPASGKLSVYTDSGWPMPAIVIYTGGYILPDEAPLPLKQACAILVRDDRIKNQQALVAGIRSISHEGASVSYYDPNMALRRSQPRTTTSQAWGAATELVKQYMRIEV